MGYTTDFTGHVAVTPPLNAHEAAYLHDFAASRRFQRASGPYQTTDNYPARQDVIDYNREQDGQPGLWCQWVPMKYGDGIEWDGGEKFYDSVQWMAYLIDTFLKPGATLQAELASPVEGRYYSPDFEHFTFDHVVNGTIDAQGDRDDDRWQLAVVDNDVRKVVLPTIAERIEADSDLAAAFETLKAAGVTASQYAAQIGEDW